MTYGAAQGSELPDMLALSHARPYGGKEGDVPGFAGSGQLAQELTEQACSGSDPALAIPLPHTTAIHRNTGLLAATKMSLQASSSVALSDSDMSA